MNDFDDFGGCLANFDFQQESNYYSKQSNHKTQSSVGRVSGSKAIAIFKNIDDDKFSYDEKLSSIGYVLSMPTYNSIYKDDFKNAVEWLYREVMGSI